LTILAPLTFRPGHIRAGCEIVGRIFRNVAAACAIEISPIFNYGGNLYGASILRTQAEWLRQVTEFGIFIWVVSAVLFYMAVRRSRRPHDWTEGNRLVFILLSVLGPVALSGFLIVAFLNWMFSREWDKKAKW
jgi:hypothetical protein